MRRWMFVVPFVPMLLLPVSSAAGGGWWSGIDLDGSHMAIGEEVSIESEVWWPTTEEAEAAETGNNRYFAYLMPFPDKEFWDRVYTEYDPDWWQPQVDSLLIGEVTFGGAGNSNINRAYSMFEVPAVDPGEYALMFCTEGCEEALGNTIPTGVTIVASADHALAANKVDDLRFEIQQMRFKHRREVRGLERRISARDRTSDVIDERMDEIDARLLSMTTAEQPSEKPSSLPYLFASGVVGVALGAGAIYSLMRARKKERLTDEALTKFLEQESDAHVS